MIKVSVVIPTYQPDEGLDRLVASLDAQTLPASEFEVVFVDDGSPDDTHERLLRVASTRPNVRVERIENSGWPCRPRNVGTDLAVGEYVAYMDHDDELGPDALRAGWEYAHANGADVLTGKEARTHKAGWAVDTYREDIPQSVGREDRNPLVPMNPHKMYRRAFLNERGIRFIEGGRVMWEDIFFNVTVQRHAKVISTLSSTEYYHWFTTKGSGSSAFRRENPEYWTWMRRVIAATDEELADAQPLAHHQLMGHHYRSRIIASFDTSYATRPAADRDMIFAESRALQADFDLTRFDDALNASGRLRAHLLRTGRQDLLMVLPDADAAVPGWGRAVEMTWDDDGILHLTVDAEWSTAGGRRHALERDGDRIFKVIPEAVAQTVPRELCDVTDEIAGATVEVGMRDRSSRFVWMLPSESAVEAQDAPDGTVRLVGRATATLDPSTALAGRPLTDSRWDLNVRAFIGGAVTQQALRTAHDSTVGLRGNGLVLAYVNDEARVTVLTDGPVAREALQRLSPESAQRTPDGAAVVTFRGRHGGAGSIPVRVPLAGGGTVHATLRVGDGSATLRIAALDRPARLVLGSRADSRPTYWAIEEVDGAIRLTAGPPAPPKQPKKVPMRARIRAAVGRMLRKLDLRR